jgi:hypothetical protein
MRDRRSFPIPKGARDGVVPRHNLFAIGAILQVPNDYFLALRAHFIGGEARERSLIGVARLSGLA